MPSLELNAEDLEKYKIVFSVKYSWKFWKRMKRTFFYMWQLFHI